MMEVRFYANENGVSAPYEWLLAAPKAYRRIIGEDLRYIQLSWPVGRPRCAPLGDGLYEVRTSLPGNRIARTLFGFLDGEILIVNIFIKKTQKTPQDELELARTRLRAAKKASRT